MKKTIKITNLDYLHIISAGLKNGEFGFLKNIINSWLAHYPNDIRSEFFLSKILLHESRKSEAIKKITRILLKDPEFLEAYEILRSLDGGIDKKAVASFIFVLSGTTDDISSIYPWAVTLRAVRMGIRKNDLTNTDKLISNLLEGEPNNPLVALAHYQYLIKKNQHDIQLIEKYHYQWPDCIQFALYLAQSLYESNQEAEAIKLLHSCVSVDPGGQVSSRILSNRDELLTFWDKNQSISLDYQIPSSIAVALNWNQLTQGERNSKKNNLMTQESPFNGNVRVNLEEINPLSVGSHARSKKESVYVVLATRQGLEKKYGKKTTGFILEQLKLLTTTIAEKNNWEAIVFLPDDHTNTLLFGLTPMLSIDPWKIKNSLGDLHKYLESKNRHIGSVLIIGGDEVVPFHKLPNPTDDSDNHVFSDNPYGTISGNFLIPDWPVGRIPDEKGSDPGLLLEQIRQIKNFHQEANKKSGFIYRIISTLMDWTKLSRFFRDIFTPPKNFGYSAAVWRRSTLAAFRPIGAGASLRVTPPFVAETIDVDNLMKSKCAFFNLHGLSNTPEWYGQKDFSERTDGPDFPVAISTKQITKFKNNVDLTFSEACYGGYIIDKTIDESIALKLISIGSQGLIASTCIAYGSVFPPLIGADLLAFIFWKYIKDGYSFGESLMQAKIGLIKVMVQRQGYLDGEDQKTLQSFVLYGDPLGFLEENIYIKPHAIQNENTSNEIKTIRDQDGYIFKQPNFPEKFSKDITEVIESYIPDLSKADIKIRHHQINLKKEFQSGFDTKKDSNQKMINNIKNHTQVTYSQKIKSARIVHQQYARLTLDESGKVIKLAVSR